MPGPGGGPGHKSPGSSFGLKLNINLYYIGPGIQLDEVLFGPVTARNGDDDQFTGSQHKENWNRMNIQGRDGEISTAVNQDAVGISQLMPGEYNGTLRCP